mmetsp:Transcript_5856/g.23704  ORF Transcript_5856/g.23704 Transcript_5856/m.23704 type:complete len:252 (-) Transcript_5856:1649-2404(-)
MEYVSTCTNRARFFFVSASRSVRLEQPPGEPDEVLSGDEPRWVFGNLGRDATDQHLESFRGFRAGDVPGAGGVAHVEERPELGVAELRHRGPSLLQIQQPFREELFRVIGLDHHQRRGHALEKRAELVFFKVRVRLQHGVDAARRLAVSRRERAEGDEIDEPIGIGLRRLEHRAVDLRGVQPARPEINLQVVQLALQHGEGKGDAGAVSCLGHPVASRGDQIPHLAKTRLVVHRPGRGERLRSHGSSASGW